MATDASKSDANFRLVDSLYLTAMDPSRCGHPIDDRDARKGDVGQMFRCAPRAG